MTNEDIIRMARQAGCEITSFVNLHDYGEDVVVFHMADLERFAALVRADERERIKAANAPVIENIDKHMNILLAALNAIRARGNT